MATVIELRSRRPAQSGPHPHLAAPAELIIFPRASLADLRRLSERTRVPASRPAGEADD